MHGSFLPEASSLAPCYSQMMPVVVSFIKSIRRLSFQHSRQEESGSRDASGHYD